MSESLRNGESEENKEIENMVEVIKISTVFDDSEILERIADSLLSEGIISGFHIDSVNSGYIMDGKKVHGGQYELNILIPVDTKDDVKREIQSKIEGEIGKKWQTPLIEEQVVQVNSKLLGFIGRAEIEHRKYKTERKRKLTLALTLLMGVMGVLGESVKVYTDRKAESVVNNERVRQLTELREIAIDVQNAINKLDDKLEDGEQLSRLPSDVGMGGGFKETQEIMDPIRKLQNELKDLLEAEKNNQ